MSAVAASPSLASMRSTRFELCSARLSGRRRLTPGDDSTCRTTRSTAETSCSESGSWCAATAVKPTSTRSRSGRSRSTGWARLLDELADDLRGRHVPSEAIPAGIHPEARVQVCRNVV